MIKIGALKDVEDMKDYVVVPQGAYQVKITKCEEISPKEREDGSWTSPRLNVGFKVLERCPEVGVDFEGKGGMVFNSYALTDKAMGFLKPLLIALGYPQDKPLEFEAEDLLDQQLVIKVKHDRVKDNATGEIKTFAKAESYKSLVDCGVKPIVDDSELPF